MLLVGARREVSGARVLPGGVRQHVDGVGVKDLGAETGGQKREGSGKERLGYAADGRAVDDLHVRGEAAAHALQLAQVDALLREEDDYGQSRPASLHTVSCR